MALAQQPGVRRWRAPGQGTWLVVVAGILAVVVIVAVTTGVFRVERPASSTGGSGVSVTDRREVAPFSSVELAGANTVVIHVGAQLSVAVTGDDNLVSRVTTVVRDGQLVIDNAGSFTTKSPMQVAVSVPSLDGVELAGAGTVTVDGVENAAFSAELGGDGTLLAAGTVQLVTAVLAGHGTLDLHDLVATDGTAQLQGTGTIRIHTTSTLDATLTGTGTILYGGDPTVTVRNTGSGVVVQD